MSGTPFFSVIIPTHDRPHFLQHAVDSVLAQTVHDFECIVVDDAGSLPVTLPPDDRFRTVRHPTNRGPAAARNTGAELARGRYLTFLDDDDLYTPDRLADSRAIADQAPITMCWANWLGEPPQRGRVLNGSVYDEILDGITPHINTATISRSHYLPMDESYPASAEVEWWLRATEQLAVSTHPEVGSFLRRHDSPRKGNGPRARAAASRRLLADYPEYFATHRRAHAFRWARLGLLELQCGNRRAATHALIRSLRVQPRASTAGHLVKAMLPKRVRG